MSHSDRHFSPDTREFVKGQNDDGTFAFEQVGVQDIDFSGRFGAKVYSSTSVAMSIGTKTFTTDTDATKFKVGDDVQISYKGDPHNYFMYGTVVAKNTTYSPGDLTIVVNDASPLINTFDDWEIQVVARPKAWLEVDVSTTSINPTSAGPFTMTVTAGKLFNFPGGTILLRSITKPGVAVLCRLFNYNSTSLILTKIGTNATVSETLSSWDVALIDANPVGIPFLQRNGLQVSISGTTLTVTAGSIRDSTDTYDLVLPSTITKDFSAAFVAGSGNGCQVLSSVLPGTATASGTTSVTGTSTTFATNFPDSNGVDWVSVTDWQNRLGNLAGPVPRTFVPITFSGPVVRAFYQSSNTAGVTNSIPGVTDATIQRGGYVSGASSFAPGGGGQGVGWLISLVRDAATGAIDAIASNTAKNVGTRNPDLPTGYTAYGVLSIVVDTATVGGVHVYSWSGTGLAQISPMTTEGDLIYQTGGVPARLGIGASGAVLTSNGTDPAWTAPTAPGLVLLNTVTANNSAGTLADTTSITSSYDSYDIEIEDIVLASNTQLRLQITDDGGSTWKTASYVNSTLNGGVNTTSVTSGIDLCSPNNVGTSTVACFNAQLRLNNPNSATTIQKHVLGQATFGTSSTNIQVNGRYGASLAGPLNGIRLITGTAAGTAVGNLVSGKMRIWGRKTS